MMDESLWIQGWHVSGFRHRSANSSFFQQGDRDSGYHHLNIEGTRSCPDDVKLRDQIVWGLCPCRLVVRVKLGTESWFLVVKTADDLGVGMLGNKLAEGPAVAVHSPGGDTACPVFQESSVLKYQTRKLDFFLHSLSFEL